MASPTSPPTSAPTLLVGTEGDTNDPVLAPTRRVAATLALLVVSIPLGVSLFFETPWIGGAPALDTVVPYRPAPLDVGAYELASGRTVDHEQAARMLATDPGRAVLSPRAGAVAVTPELVELGRHVFYEETFGNEVFFTEVLGLFDGALTPWMVARAVAALHGGSTTNLRIRLERDTTIGGTTFHAGALLDTGLDVPRGARMPLGLRARISAGRVRVGVTCAACHAAVDPVTGHVLEGAPNTDLNAGLLYAFATNSAALFRQTGVDPKGLPATGASYVGPDGNPHRLPDPQALEDAVDADLLTWPPGSFDATPDLRNDPAQIPSSFTFGAGPYGWSGFAAVGWFQGLTAIGNYIHGAGSDPTASADESDRLFGVDRDTYLGIVLQRSAGARYRFTGRGSPSELFDRIDPTGGAPGLNQLVPMPGFPTGSRLAPTGLFAGTPGRPFASQLNALSAFQNTLAPPPTLAVASDAVRRGAEVFARARCGECHAGRWFTDHRVIPAREIGTQWARASALAPFARVAGPAEVWPPDTVVPIPVGTPTLRVDSNSSAENAAALGFAVSDPAGGYKVPSLVGLAVTAPYLHDGGVAAAEDALASPSDDTEGRRRGDGWVVAREDHVGASGTVMHGITPDPRASLRALLDRRLRTAVVEKNRTDVRLERANVDGSGHTFWVDPPAGFTLGDQDDLLAFLLSIDDEPEIIP